MCKRCGSQAHVENPGVLYLIYPVAEAHNSLAIANVFDSIRGVANFIEHSRSGLHRAPMQFPGKGCDCGGDGTDEIGATTCRNPGGEGGGIRLVIRMQD